jgi:ABC-type Na+ transport system ATPase subunit NatA
MFLNDQETDVDLLYYEAIAKTVVALIRSNPENPVTVGVHGDWGAGKSSVLKMTAAALAADKGVLVLPFVPVRRTPSLTAVEAGATWLGDGRRASREWRA